MSSAVSASFMDPPKVLSTGAALARAATTIDWKWHRLSMSLASCLRHKYRSQPKNHQVLHSASHAFKPTAPSTWIRAHLSIKKFRYSIDISIHRTLWSVKLNLSPSTAHSFCVQLISIAYLNLSTILVARKSAYTSRQNCAMHNAHMTHTLQARADQTSVLYSRLPCSTTILLLKRATFSVTTQISLTVNRAAIYNSSHQLKGVLLRRIYRCQHRKNSRHIIRDGIGSLRRWTQRSGKNSTLQQRQVQARYSQRPFRRTALDNTCILLKQYALHVDKRNPGPQRLSQSLHWQTQSVRVLCMYKHYIQWTTANRPALSREAYKGSEIAEVS